MTGGKGKAPFGGIEQGGGYGHYSTSTTTNAITTTTATPSSIAFAEVAA